MADDTDSTAQRVWVVDDDRAVRFVLCTALRDAGYRVEGFDGAASALAMLDTQPPPDLLFTDVRMPGDDGLVLLDKLKAAHPQLPVIVMSAYTDVASTAGAFRGGAQEFLSKPFDLDDAVALAQRVLPAPDALADAPTPAAVEPMPDQRPQLVGDTPAMRALFRAIGRLAQAPLSVLINGETGTGKELVAHALHHESPRVQGPFVALNTAAIPSELLESELFGHEAGAFTGAQRRHVGRFEQANGGTLFLDEIGDMPLPLQTRLLRVLAEGEFFRVGGRELIRVDVRVIAATHQDLESLVAQGRFRADLLHRLDVVRLRLPPLRERRDDITQLADTFLAAAVRKLDAPPKRLTAAALQALREHDWPGNVRELENVCWRMAALAASDTIGVADVDSALHRGGGPRTRAAGDPGQWETLLSAWARQRLAEGAEGLHAQVRDRVDQALLEAALQITHGRRAEAAARLGMGRNTLTRKLGAGRRRGG
ncbi:nitrogen regulation protein NR(I) [Stenotrophomonas rhizophila]|jgi:two-component system nitrogen regulation response regulator GlnG|uniref:nitrogen regulation protein NR(I) n=1 Tax=Stenotrophomonas rhizophila TaxID=216778 RepID=UPI002A6B4FC3|nr:nitrogen regulation protein NR(I) [Stenotrophomonas rhizophila]MDY0954916.1 nitrogen regulation protein NR(I) [Stenotrophomonas rhizophila]